MAGGLGAVLAHDLLAHGLASFLRFRSLDRARATGRRLRERLGPPEVPRELLEAVPCHLHIKREMTLARLESLALRKSGQAVRAIVARLGDEEEFDHLRAWTLNSLRALAEPGDAWAINAIVGPSGPLELGGTAVREQALKVLMELTVKGSPAAIRAAASALRFSEGLKDCRPFKLQARTALEHFAKVTPRAEVDAATVSAVLGLLGLDSVETRCSAIRALAVIAPKGDAEVKEALLKAVVQKRGGAKEQLCAVHALARVAPEDEFQAIGAAACTQEDPGTLARARLSEAAAEALRGLGIEPPLPQLFCLHC